MRKRTIKKRFMGHLTKPTLTKVPADYDHLERIFYQIFWRLNQKRIKKKEKFDDVINELWKSGRIVKVSENRASGLEEPEFFTTPQIAVRSSYKYIKVPRELFNE